MIYLHIPAWMAEENPAFAAAVARYYSVAHGQRYDAAGGEVAARRMVTELLERGYHRPALVATLAAWITADQEAWARGDHAYFRRVSRALAREWGKGEARAQDPIKYMFEAYFYLRKRAGEGSPLPYKQEVKQIAALIWAFRDGGILAKLSEYLWHNTGLTAKELAAVLARQEQILGHHNKELWAYWLRRAGLAKLRQRRPKRSG